MSYLAALEQLNAMVPELYTGQGKPRRKFSLDEIRILLHALGDPHVRFPAVLIAGTNGKGSTAATLASILSASGMKVGLYTSPHLARPNERICVGRVEIADKAFGALYFRVHDAAQRLVLEGGLPQMPSYFEVLTAMAFLYFAEAGVEVAVLEVGMGGRLDATNIVDPLVSVITDISLDHTEWLGSSISAIAWEKAGILRQDGALVTLPQHPEANQVLGEAAIRLRVRGVSATRYLPAGQEKALGAYSIEALGAAVVVDSPLAGAHQHRNVALAVATAVELAEQHRFPVTATSVAEGIKQTRWPGRLERVKRDGIEWVLDVAHNAAGASALCAGLRDSVPDTRTSVMVFSCLRDKPVAEMAQILFPLFDRVIVAPLHTARAASMESILLAAEAAGTAAIAAGSIPEAMEMAMEQARLQGADGSRIVVSGSVYLVGEARSWLFSECGVER